MRFIKVMLKLGIQLHEIGFSEKEIFEIFEISNKAIMRIVFQ